MGSSCCHAESPCGSAEERSVLLKNDSKTTTATGDTTVVGTCGPEGDDEMRKTPDDNNIKVEVKAEEVKVKAEAVEVKAEAVEVKAEAVEVKAVEVKAVEVKAVEVKAVEVKVKAEAVQVKQSPEVGDSEPNNTQENRALQEVVKQKATPSPRKGSEPEENSSRAQDEDAKNRPAGSEEAELLQCTLNSPQKAAADWQVFKATNAAPKEENPASTQDKIPDIASLTAETVCPENHTEINTTSEHITLANAHDNDEEAGSEVTADSTVAEPSGEFPQNNEALSAPNTAACQVSSISVVSQEIDKESPSCAVTEHSENGSSSVCDEAGPEVIKSHDVSESSPGSEPSGLNHSGEERSAANFVGQPETTAPSDASESSKSNQDAKPDLECATMSSKEVTSSESIIGEKRKDHNKDGDVPVAKEDEEIKEEVENTSPEAETEAGNAEIPELTGKEELSGSTSTGVTADEISVTENEDSAEDGLGNSEEDLYRGAEELSASQTNKPGTHLKVEDRCSLAPAVDILSYSEREWKGNTAKSALIRKGYEEMSQRFGSLRRVRGDNYCALRATLFQVLSHSTQLPSWMQEEDVIMLPEQLEAQKGLISQWTFPGECLQGDGTGDATLQLKGYMELLRNKWQAAVDCPSAVERQQLCEQVFQGGEEELGLLEALKLLMLGRAAELHGCMQTGEDVPLFCWLLFARDTSDCPRSFLSNHLSHVGLSAGLEQVEMFLLGYALQCTIQVYRLYKADTEEFVTYYPDDHKDDWPSVCLVTEDDRHYNVPVVDAAEHEELDSS